MQTFYLEVLVRDYPPVFESSKTGTKLEKVSLYVKEDHKIDAWVNPKGFYAVTPDPEVNDFTEIQWSLGQDSTIGSKMVIDGQGGKPSTFEYTPPDDFFGIDYFSLIMDEGDNAGDFEVCIGRFRSPRFETNLQNLFAEAKRLN